MTLHELIDSSFTIIHGCAMQKIPSGVRVVNIHSMDRVAVFSPGGEPIETTLDDIELRRIRRFIEDNYLDMYEKWSEYNREGFYQGRTRISHIFPRLR